MRRGVAAVVTLVSCEEGLSSSQVRQQTVVATSPIRRPKFAPQSACDVLLRHQLACALQNVRTRTVSDSPGPPTETTENKVRERTGPVAMTCCTKNANLPTVAISYNHSAGTSSIVGGTEQDPERRFTKSKSHSAMQSSATPTISALVHDKTS
ncbi:hypothetical protein AcW1_008573 [Taiwanofungus camphoratus]|nr:hypothetical protein AcW1_008573 [Antrodia cinnamomea]